MQKHRQGKAWAPGPVVAQRMRALIADAGLTLERHGRAWRVHGFGVDVLTADLANMAPADLEPYQWTSRGNWDR